MIPFLTVLLNPRPELHNVLINILKKAKLSHVC